MKRMIAIVAAMVCGIVSASAADLGATPTLRAASVAAESLSGFHFYVVGGAEFGNTEIGAETDEFAANLNGLGSTGWLGEIGAGYDYIPHGSRIGVRVMAAANIGNAETSLTVNDHSATLGRDWGGLGGVGLVYAASSSTKIYGVGGYTASEFSAEVDGVEIGSDTLDGWFGEAGIETRIAEGVSAKLAGRYTQYNSVHIDPIAIDHDTLQVLAGVKFDLTK